MKHLAGGFLLLITLVICSTVICAQEVRVGGQPTITAPLGSETFSSSEGRFSISLPKRPSGYRSQSPESPAGHVEAVLFNWIIPYGRFAVAYIDRPEPLEMVSKNVLDNFRDSLVAKSEAIKGKLINEAEITIEKHPGRELKFELPDGLFLMRIYLVNQRMYQLSATIKNDKRSQETEAAKTFASFKLLNQTDLEAELKKKIAEATPSPLPQEPIAKRLKSDAEDEGLKGRVKTVFTESEDLSGTWSVSKRKPSSMAYYNESGNLTKRDSYDYRGHPSDITVYGYLDGERVSHFKSIDYEYDPPAGIVVVATGESAKNKYDPRYSYKFKFKYEGGRLVEKDWYGSDGKLWMRYTYNYKGNQKEELVYSADGSLNQKYLYTLDDKGNELEKISYQVKDDSIRDKYSSSYEFDAKGNWIKKTVSKWVTKDGKSSFEPYYVDYRTITYY